MGIVARTEIFYWDLMSKADHSTGIVEYHLSELEIFICGVEINVPASLYPQQYGWSSNDTNGEYAFSQLEFITDA